MEKFNEARYTFSKSKINKIRRNLYDIKNPKNLFRSKIKKIEKNLLELKESLFKPKKYYDYDHAENKGIKDVRHLFDLSIDKDCYKPIKTVSDFDDNNDYIEYESKGDKDKTLSITEYLSRLRLYLRDIIDDYKTQGVWKI